MSRRKRWAYLVVMLCGGIALSVDRFFLSGEAAEPSVAAATERIPLHAASPAVSSDATPALSMPELPFPRGVAAYTSVSRIRDLFAPPAAVLKGSLDGATADKGRSGLNPGERSGHVGHAKFAAQHRANGVMSQGRLKIAIVDGAWLQIGQSIDGCELTSILGNEVRFECYDGEAVLAVTGAGTLTQD